jgi:hypothetical protein
MNIRASIQVSCAKVQQGHGGRASHARKSIRGASRDAFKQA